MAEQQQPPLPAAAAAAAAAAYNTIKRALVATHALTPYQQVDRLMAMEPLGGRKPSELLAAMQKLRPAADDVFFAWAFLQRLPCEIRVLLARDDHADMCAVAEKAEDLVAIHQPKHHDVTAVAAATTAAQELPDGEEEDTVAAAKISLATDASATHIGAALQQRR
jgi:hypothetical protein